jgi:hypothetical protein
MKIGDRKMKIFAVHLTDIDYEAGDDKHGPDRDMIKKYLEYADGVIVPTSVPQRRLLLYDTSNVNSFPFSPDYFDHDVTPWPKVAVTYYDRRLPGYFFEKMTEVETSIFTRKPLIAIALCRKRNADVFVVATELSPKGNFEDILKIIDENIEIPDAMVRV